DSAYPMLIQRRIDSASVPLEVVNAGVSGETSSALVDRLDWLLRGTFDVIVIETGANDGLRGIPSATLRSNLEKVIDRIRAARRRDARGWCGFWTRWAERGAPAKFKVCLRLSPIFSSVFFLQRADRYGNSGNADSPRNGDCVRGRTVSRGRVPSPHAWQPSRD